MHAVRSLIALATRATWPRPLDNFGGIPHQLFGDHRSTATAGLCQLARGRLQDTPTENQSGFKTERILPAGSLNQAIVCRSRA